LLELSWVTDMANNNNTIWENIPKIAFIVQKIADVLKAITAINSGTSFDVVPHQKETVVKVQNNNVEQ